MPVNTIIEAIKLLIGEEPTRQCVAFVQDLVNKGRMVTDAVTVWLTNDVPHLIG